MKVTKKRCGSQLQGGWRRPPGIWLSARPSLVLVPSGVGMFRHGRVTVTGGGTNGQGGLPQRRKRRAGSKIGGGAVEGRTAALHSAASKSYGTGALRARPLGPARNNPPAPAHGGRGRGGHLVVSWPVSRRREEGPCPT